MSRLGGTGEGGPLVADISADVIIMLLVMIKY